MTRDHPKPRVNFCWWCSRKLWGRHHIEAEVEGHKRIFHKFCYREFVGPESDYQAGKLDISEGG